MDRGAVAGSWMHRARRWGVAVCLRRGLCECGRVLRHARGHLLRGGHGRLHACLCGVRRVREGACKPGFTGVQFLTPANDAQVRGGTIAVSARLVVDPSFASVVQYPDRLNFAAARGDGGDAGSLGTVTRNGGVYTVQWTLPSGQAQLTLT